MTQTLGEAFAGSSALIERYAPAVSFWAALGFALLATAHVLLRKRDVRAAIGWMGLIWLSPFIGAALYGLLGINRIRRRAFALDVRTKARAVASPEQPCVPDDVSKLASPTALALRAYMDKVTPRPLVAANLVRMLRNGDEAYPAMLAAIDGATKSVTLATYIFANDETGRAFVEALARAKERGVEVRVLVDAVGCRYSFPPAHITLGRRGVPVARFLPVFLSPWLNLRNHRKILVVDGVRGFTGGMNIRHHHVVAGGGRAATRDTHFALEGPVVAQLQEVFAQDWAFTTRELLTGPLWFPEQLPAAGPVLARAVSDGPDKDFEALNWSLLGAVACARSSVRVVTPYFLPEPPLITALNVAAMRGVDVRIVIPERGNLPIVQWAMWTAVRRVLDNGCRVYASPRPFDHSKLMVVDDTWVLFGSGNWDPRSLRLNFEVIVEAYDPALARVVRAETEAKLIASREITARELDERHVLLRLRDGAARLFSPYL